MLQAEPGAGKTTRVPVALLEAGLADRGEIVVAQPRRLAARMAAARVAETLGEPLGRRCGYQVRFESVVGPDTRIRFVTEGLLARRLRDDPELRGVGMVLLDEFHERHVDTDVCLALLRRLQTTRRDDLRIGVMSATLEPDPVARYLECAPLRCEGRTFPVEIEYVPDKSDRPLGSQVAAAVRRLLADGLTGSVLVFLPGAAEIRACRESCPSSEFEVVELHGELDSAEQDRAVRPGARRKLILATNVAETSVTIEGVVAVIDSGLARRPTHHPWTGIPSLQLGKISKASAVQRAGRAGRMGPGRCLRLYAQHDFDRRPDHDAPELHRLDLASAALDLRAAGVLDPRALAWFDPPPSASLEAADALLRLLEAIDERGALTELGREMLELPLHPRVARVLVEARRRGVPAMGAKVAALLSERSIRRRSATAPARRSASADVLVDAQDLEAALREGPAFAKARGIDLGACRTVDRVRKQLGRLVGGGDRQTDVDEAIGLALLTGFSDRLARVRPRPGAAPELALQSGGRAELSPESAVHDATLVLCLDVEDRSAGQRGRTLVRSAATVELEWLLECFPHRLVEDVVARFDATLERALAHRETRFDDLLVDSVALPDVPKEAAGALRDAALAKGPEAFVDGPDALVGIEARTRFAAPFVPGLPILDRTRACEVLARLCEGRRSFDELRKADLVSHLLAEIPPELRTEFERTAPSHVSLAGGRRLAVHYELDRPPWVQSRLQDFYGSLRGPAIAKGNVPVVLHLLAPNQRAVQVTTDLAGFWERHYPEQRRALMRRYPRHDWPEQPATAEPPAIKPPTHRRRR